MTTHATVVAVSPRKRTISQLILLVIGIIVFTVLEQIVPRVVHSLVAPVIAIGAFWALARALDRLIGEMQGMVSRLIAALNAAAQSTSGEIEQVRNELHRQNETQEAKAAGFQISPEVKGLRQGSSAVP